MNLFRYPLASKLSVCDPRPGQARVSVEPTDTLATLAARLQQEMPALPQFKLSRDAGHKDYLAPANATVQALRLQHGDRIFADHSADTPAEPAPATPVKSHMMGQTLSGKEVVEIVESASPAQAPRVLAKDVKLDEVDEILAKMDGRQKLKGSESKRGFGSASIDSMAVEPYDERLLKEQDIKLMSFNAYLRKLKSVQGGGKFSQLKRHDFGSYGEAGGKCGLEKGWGERAVAMNRIPKPMTLNRQKYRHVDRGHSLSRALSLRLSVYLPLYFYFSLSFSLVLSAEAYPAQLRDVAAACDP